MSRRNRDSPISTMLMTCWLVNRLWDPDPSCAFAGQRNAAEQERKHCTVGNFLGGFHVSWERPQVFTLRSCPCLKGKLANNANHTIVSIYGASMRLRDL